MPIASPTLVYLGLGSNVSLHLASNDACSPLDILKQANIQINKLPQTNLLKTSSFYDTSPVDSSGDNYTNAVIAIQTTLSADELLHYLQIIEQQFGRTRPYHNAPRTLDLDILLYGTTTINQSNLIVPHPRLTERAFVLVPLAEIAPNITLYHPKTATHQPIAYFIEQVTQAGNQHIKKLPNSWYAQQTFITSLQS